MSAEEMPAVTLARIEGKLDLLHVEIKAAQEKGNDHEERIRALEKRPIGITPAKFLGGVVAFGSIAAAMSSVATVLAR